MLQLKPLSLLACAFLISSLLFALEDPHAAAEPQAADPSTYAKPVAEHQFLAERLGKWKTEVTMWMDPSQPPVKTHGEAEFTALYDGLFVQSVYSGDFMGTPFHGMGIEGFDSIRKTCTSFWIDSTGSASIYGEGSCDLAKKELTIRGTTTDPASGSSMGYRNVTRMESKDRFVMEMYMSFGDKEMKVLEILHTRK